MLNQLIAGSLPFIPKPLVHFVAKRYIAGETLEDALYMIAKLNAKNISATVDQLGEYVKDRSEAQKTADGVTKVLDAIVERKLDSGISVKLTSLGLDIDEELCYANLKALVRNAGQKGRFVRIDMEDSPYTARTLAMYQRLREDGFDNTGVVIQARLRRSEADILSLARYKASVRLCKGIYREPESVALTDPQAIRENYKKLLLMLFENGMKPAIATHDDVLLNFALETITKNKIGPERYEFQMLLGVRESKRNELAGKGYPMRVYVPFGGDWYGYSVRRLQENPDIAGHVFKAFFTRS